MKKSHSERAAELFTAGYNCSQSVTAAFADVMEMNEKQALRLSASFGGGFGRSREVCGAVCGGCIVLGALYGYDAADDMAAKSEHYALVREFMRRFSEEDGTYICRELLGGAEAGGEPSERTPEFYKTRPCPRLIKRAAEIIDGIIEEKSGSRIKKPFGNGTTD